MKKFLALLLTCLLCLPVLSFLSASPALALELEMSKTRSFCALLDEEGIFYEFTGKSSTGNWAPQTISMVRSSRVSGGMVY